MDEYVDGKLAHTGNVEFEGCEYCRLRGRGKFKLHPGSLYLYFKDGRLRVPADIDYMYIYLEVFRLGVGSKKPHYFTQASYYSSLRDLRELPAQLYLHCILLFSHNLLELSSG